MSDEPSSRYFVVRGRVQGVGFRHFVWKKATELELRGSVSNLKDGSVEVEAWGPEARLDALKLHLERGPRWSRVDVVDCDRTLQREPPPGPFSIRT